MACLLHLRIQVATSLPCPKTLLQLSRNVPSAGAAGSSACSQCYQAWKMHAIDVYIVCNIIRLCMYIYIYVYIHNIWMNHMNILDPYRIKETNDRFLYTNMICSTFQVVCSKPSRINVTKDAALPSSWVPKNDTVDGCTTQAVDRGHFMCIMV